MWKHAYLDFLADYLSCRCNGESQAFPCCLKLLTWLFRLLGLGIHKYGLPLPGPLQPAAITNFAFVERLPWSLRFVDHLCRERPCICMKRLPRSVMQQPQCYLSKGSPTELLGSSKLSDSQSQRMLPRRVCSAFFLSVEASFRNSRYS